MTRENFGAPKRIVPKYIVLGIVLIVAILLAFAAFKWITLPDVGLKNREVIDARYHIPAGHYHIGDQIPVELHIRTLAGVQYQRPDLTASNLGKLELKRDARTTFTWLHGGRLDTLRYRVTAWEVGEYKLPALIIRYHRGKRQGVSKISPVYLKVESVLPVGKTNADLLKLDIKGIKGPLDLPPRYQILTWSLAILAALTLIIVLGKWIRDNWRKRKKAGLILDSGPVIVEEPAHLIALRRLGYLEAGEMIPQQAWKPYYSELSEISREYMEKRFHTKALEMTTEEFLAAIAKSSIITREHQKILTNVLETADLVKFAKYLPVEKKAQDDLHRIRRLVEETAERPPKSPPESTENTPDEVPA